MPRQVGTYVMKRVTHAGIDPVSKRVTARGRPVLPPAMAGAITDGQGYRFTTGDGPS
jgi:hypothetical protein